MTKFRIALLQLATEDEPSANLIKGIEAVKKAKSMGADLALFPEMWNIGYKNNLVSQDFAVCIKSEYIKKHQEIAKEQDIAIGLTALFKGNQKPRNSLLLIDSGGQIIMEYHKVHICSFSEPECRLEAGNELMVVPLKFKAGVVNIGAMICYDREFPETARTLVIKGAEIIITANACLLRDDKLVKDARVGQFRTRAFENMVGVAMANYPSPFNGYSCAYDVDGSELFSPKMEENIYIAEFDIERIKNWRKTEIWGYKYSRPDCYIPVSEEIKTKNRNTHSSVD